MFHLYGYKSQDGDLVRCLVHKGADVNIKNKDGVSEWDCYTVDPEIFALNILCLLIFRVVLFSSLEHTDEN